MTTGEVFPLPWERLLWSSPPGFPTSITRPTTQYALTDFRLAVRRNHRTIQELALDDIDGVMVTQSWWQRAAGTSTVRVLSRRHLSPLTLADVPRGPQLVSILQSQEVNENLVRSALSPGARSTFRLQQRLLLGATMALGLAYLGVGLAHPHSLPPVTFAANDPIAPEGHRRPTKDVVAFMERDVMPFARRAFAPLVGGADQVTCKTCHGLDAVDRSWMMPAVRALPEPTLRFAGLETSRLWIDPQIRNAVYGYLAEEDNQPTATYMRHVVMPGMAKLLNRPAYDFARSYEYNQSRAAVGCYHCHLVE